LSCQYPHLIRTRFARLPDHGRTERIRIRFP
jgi:hypothetical protein